MRITLKQLKQLIREQITQSMAATEPAPEGDEDLEDEDGAYTMRGFSIEQEKDLERFKSGLEKQYKDR